MVAPKVLRDESDRALVERIRHGESSQASAAATELFGRYQQRVYRWCLRHVRNHEDALDLAQDVLLIAYRSLHTYEGRAPFGGWLFTVAHHRCLRVLRKRAVVYDEDIVLEDIPDVRRDAETAMADEQDQAAMLGLIRDRLDPVEQRVVWLRCVEEMPVDEITRVLRLGNATGARGVLQTARRKLRAARGDQSPQGGDGR